jgi:hypothetical protein
MKVARSIPVLLLAGALVLAMGGWVDVDHSSLSSSPSASLATPGYRPARCHAQGGENAPDSLPLHSPHQAPVSYRCCLTSHGVAMVPTSSSPELSSQFFRLSPQIEPVLDGYLLTRLQAPTVPSADPPGITPLRI